MSRVLDLWAGMTGTVLDFAGTTAPDGWLFCFGQVLNRADQPHLFDKIGTTYNTGGETAAQFRLPDCRGRASIGKDDMGGAAASRVTSAVGGIDGATLGASGGSQSHTLTTAQMPQHNHGVTDPGHAHSSSFRLGQAGGGFNFPYGGTTDNATFSGVTVASGTTGISIQNAGTGGAHPNVQPGIVFNKIIKT